MSAEPLSKSAWAKDSTAGPLSGFSRTMRLCRMSEERREFSTTVPTPQRQTSTPAFGSSTQESSARVQRTSATSPGVALTRLQLFAAPANARQLPSEIWLSQETDPGGGVLSSSRGGSDCHQR